MDETLRLISPSLPELREIQDDLQQVWATGLLTTAAFTRRFEEAVAAYIGVRHAIALNSCTSGLVLVFRALDLRGEVILPSFTFTASGLALLWNELEPVFADVDPRTYTLDSAQVETLISDRTVALMPVNVFGLPPDYRTLSHIAERHKLKLVVDSAQGLGATYFEQPVGRFGDVEVFSLSPTKVVTAIEGGLITTNDDSLAQRVRQMRDYGKSPDGEDILWQGLSARFSELHAIVGYHNFKRLDELKSNRQALISLYRSQLADLPGLSFQFVPDGYSSSENYVVICVKATDSGVNRGQLHKMLSQVGVETKRYFCPPLHQQHVYSPWRNRYEGKLPVTEELADSCLALPLYAHMTKAQIFKVVEVIRNVLLPTCKE